MSKTPEDLEWDHCNHALWIATGGAQLGFEFADRLTRLLMDQRAAKAVELRDSLELAKLLRDEARDERDDLLAALTSSREQIERITVDRREILNRSEAELERVTQARDAWLAAAKTDLRDQQVEERERLRKTLDLMRLDLTAAKAGLERVTAERDYEVDRSDKVEAQLATLRTAAERVFNTVTADLAESKETGHSHQSNRTIRSYILPLAEALDSIAQADKAEALVQISSGNAKHPPAYRTKGCAPKPQRRDTFDPKLFWDVVAFLERLPANGTLYDRDDHESKGWALATRLRGSEHTPSQPAAASYPAEPVEELIAYLEDIGETQNPKAERLVDALRAARLGGVK